MMKFVFHFYILDQQIDIYNQYKKMTGHHSEPVPDTNNVDLAYRLHFRQQKAKAPAFINWKGDNQYIWVYTRNGLTTGAYYGSMLGVAPAIYYRKVSHIPIYALGFGLSYAAFHASSAYFRNEI